MFGKNIVVSLFFRVTLNVVNSFTVNLLFPKKKMGKKNIDIEVLTLENE